MALIVRGTSFATFAPGNFFRKVQKSWPSNRGLHRLSALETASKKSHANRRTGRLLHRFNRGPPARTQNQNSLARGAAQNSGLTDERSQRNGALRLRLARVASDLDPRTAERQEAPFGRLSFAEIACDPPRWVKNKALRVQESCKVVLMNRQGRQGSPRKCGEKLNHDDSTGTTEETTKN